MCFTRRNFLAQLAALACASRSASAKPAPGMAYRTLGRTGLKVSEIACGAVGEAVLRRALDLGVNYVDTAPCYYGGDSEREIGRVLKGRRDEVVLATKFQRVHFKDIKPPPKDYLESVEGSLKRLGTDRVDIILYHEVALPERAEDEDVLEAFDKLKQQGKARFLGLSTHSTRRVEIADAALATGRYDVLMLTHNPFDLPGSETILRKAEAQNVGLVAMKAVGFFARWGNRRENPKYHEKMKELHKRGGKKLSLEQTAIAWALGDPAVASVALTMRNMKEVEANVAVAGQKLTLLERIEFQRFACSLAGEVCRWCGACQAACPQRIAIPDIHRFALYFHGYGERERARHEYQRLPVSQRASACHGCGRCEQACPNGLPVRAWLAQARATLGQVHPRNRRLIFFW
ncbi:MAG: 4Fe-4S dicluster domain-containing protein [Planctomycetes bacterium]|nr:4Fe-4S dicluster domain-containing protein [Planctomycetota bacterium]